jgi:hypothetical protein
MTEDDQIARLFATTENDIDEAFVLRVTRAVLAEQRRAADWAAARKRIAAETSATGAAVAAFYLLARLAPVPSDGVIDLVSPAIAGALILACWFATALLPDAGRATKATPRTSET